MPNRLLIGFLMGACLARGADLRYWIEPCTHAATACQSGDVQLAEWAFQAWQKAAGGKLKLEKVNQAEAAHIRLHWAEAGQDQYGETIPVMVNGVRGAEVYVRPDLSVMSPDVGGPARKDALLRDTIVYLTCLHETGHALGLSHTDAFPDIMYYFGYGGDIPEYFGRYRRTLRTRADIAKNSGLSPQDQARLIQVLR
ncbi:MAG: hypothetical protein ACRD5L_08225 [Bryobacteraceae bacterium]